jgi:dihydrofolate reductase
MGRLIVSMQVSLDGYIEAQGQDDGSWLRIDEEVHRAFNELAAGADAFLYGRKVYEVMIPYWPDAIEDATKPAYEREYGRLWVETPKIVCSTSLQEARWNTRVMPPAALDEVATLKQQRTRYLLCYGGAQLVSGLQQRGLVDEYVLFVHPSALGGGVPFFRARVDLNLVDVRRFAQGALALRYTSAGGAPVGK